MNFILNFFTSQQSTLLFRPPYTLSCLFLYAITSSAALVAQTSIPDAGRLNADIESERIRLSTETPYVLPIEPPPQPALTKSNVSFRLTGIELRGNSVFTESELIDLVSSKITTKVTFEDLVALADTITHYYRKHGYLLARAYIPAQEINTGNIRISILEGRIDKIRLTNSSDLSDTAFSARNLIPRDKPLQHSDMERSILLLNDLNGVKVQATLAKGARVGTSDLMLKAEPDRRFSGYLEYDNNGNEYTGENRFGGRLSYASPFGFGGILNARILDTADDLSYARISWRTPLSKRGLTGEIYRSQMEYTLGGNLASSNATGDSSITGLKLSYPFVRTLDSNIYVNASFEQVNLEDNIDITRNTKTSDRTTLAVEARTLSSERAYSWSMSITNGDLEIEPELLDAATAQKAGSFQRFNASYSEIYHFSRVWSIYATGYIQWASQNLDSSEKFGLGGPNAVRAYQQGEALGDHGYLLSTELRYSFENGIVLSSFVDTGAVKLNTQPWSALTQTPSYKNKRTLSGFGLGLFWASDSGFSVNASMATPLGGNKESFNGVEVEQQNGDVLAWLQLQQQF